jgi:hypothetical protein
MFVHRRSRPIAEHGTKPNALFYPQPVTPHLQLAPAVFGAWVELVSLSQNTVKPLASSSLRHVPLCDAPSFETRSVAPKLAAKVMHPALDPQEFRRPDRIQTNVPSSSGLTCLVSGFF